MVARWTGFVLVAGVAPVAAQGRTASFERVRTTLSARCYPCHGPDANKRKGTGKLGLRLDTEAGVRSVVEPFRPDESELVRRLTVAGKDRMPPAGKGARLTTAQVDLIRDWIAGGAAWSTHWADVRPAKAELPFEMHPVDAFVRARLERDGLRATGRADRRTLIRRVALDLTGLPPTPEETDAFLADHRPGAWGRLVDRLLASPAFGERQARPWLDAARYADSAGYADDPPRTIWAWRDWVIRAFNAGKPFDRFTVEQIAGDLLPHPTEDQLVATAFHRNTMTNSEGGTDDEEFRSVAVSDRVITTMQTWMGVTIGCAECHTHKFDPIEQREFYGLYAMFNTTTDSDKRDERPTLKLFSDRQREQMRAWRAEIPRLEAALATDESARWRTAPHPGARVLRFALDAREPPQVAAAFVSKSAPRPRGRYVRIELPGKAVHLHLAEVQVMRGATNIALRGKASQISTDYNGPARLAIDGNTDGHFIRAKSTSHTARAQDPWWEVDLGAETEVDRIVIWNRTDSRAVLRRLHDFRVRLLDAKRRSVWQRTIKAPPSPSLALTPSTLPAVEVDAVFRAGSAWIVLLHDPLPDVGAAELEVTATRAKRALVLTDVEATDDATLADSLRSTHDRLVRLRAKLGAMKPRTTVPVMREQAAGKRRATHIHVRGNFRVKGARVSPGVPACFPPLPEGVKHDRLAFARWLVSRDNPRTARVVVNRFWQELFGIGLVATSEDFGVQGERPSHPKLLDWLAADFMEGGWNIKALLRTIVTSETYRQTSKATAAMREHDPANRLLARGPSFRLSAEMVRDQALAVSGLLSRKMYGPPVRPPRPKLGLRAAFGASTDWKTSRGENRYRRAIYTTWRRSIPYPSMATFDAPSREVCTVRRIRTNTPLQALVTLNDPVYVEAAQALARRMVRAGDTAARRVERGFELCLARPPRPNEVSRLVRLYDEAHSRYARDPAKARAMATIPLGPVPEGVGVADLAAWTVVANVLMNLDEFLVKR